MAKPRSIMVEHAGLCGVFYKTCPRIRDGHNFGANWGVRVRAANTFNNKERVYSRAIAFSNRRCSVPLESTLPNIALMYIKLIYMYIA